MTMIKTISTPAILLMLMLFAAISHAQLVIPSSDPARGLKEKTGAPFPKGHYGALEKLPDWGGIWFRIFEMPAPGASPPAQPKLKGEYKAHFEAWKQEVAANNGLVASDRSNCSSPGMPIFMQIPQYPYEFLFTPGRITIYQEAWMQIRRIWTDGRVHPEDPDPSYFGHSIGHWEADTLIVDTIGINDNLEIGMGMKHSDKLRITERIYIPKDDHDTLINEMTLYDPEALAEPFSLTLKYKRDRYGDLIEFHCAENDRNKVDAEGHTLFE